MNQAGKTIFRLRDENRRMRAVVEAARAVHDAKDGFKRAEIWPRLTAALKELDKP